jgi:hypothetical protein
VFMLLTVYYCLTWPYNGDRPCENVAIGTPRLCPDKLRAAFLRLTVTRYSIFKSLISPTSTRRPSISEKASAMAKAVELDTFSPFSALRTVF